MAWYRAGTVSVANGSTTVDGAGTDFVSNAQVGEAFLGPDGRVYEVAQVVSATRIILGAAYQGAGAGGQGYAVLPTSSFARDLALGAAQLLNTFAAVRDGIGQGMIADGTVALPGIRFAADQDTGLRRAGENAVSIMGGGVDRLAITGNGSVGIGTANPQSFFHITRNFANVVTIQNTAQTDRNAHIYFADRNNVGWRIGTDILGTNDDSFGIYKDNRGLIMKLDGNGNFIVGTPSAPCHTIARGEIDGDQILNVSGLTAGSAFFYSGAGPAASSAATAIKVSSSSVTGRSINAGGTVNASGADYAEYMTKADGCGSVAKGDVCGVDADGRLTRGWSAAVSFVVKSTDPAYVGGDIWSGHLSTRPELQDGESDTAFAERAAAWEAEFEKARACVDRIAFCGQVPVNVTGDFAVGDYVIAAANGSGIKAIAIAQAEITFDQYRRRIGKIWAVRDDRAWVDVQHG